MDDRARIGLRIAELRKKRGLTQEALAIKAGILLQSLVRIEAGKFSVKIDTLSKIASALDCTLEIIEDGLV